MFSFTFEIYRIVRYVRDKHYEALQRFENMKNQKVANT